MKHRILAERYVNALIHSIPQENLVSELKIASKTIDTIINNEQEFKKVLIPFVSKEYKENLILGLAKNLGASSTLSNFFSLIIQKNRVVLFSSFRDLIDEKLMALSNQVNVVIETPLPLDQQQAAAIVQTLEAKTNATLNPVFKVEPNLLGGFRATIKNTVYDGSVQHSIEKVRQKFSHC